MMTPQTPTPRPLSEFEIGLDTLAQENVRLQKMIARQAVALTKLQAENQALKAENETLKAPKPVTPQAEPAKKRGPRPKLATGTFGPAPISTTVQP